MGTTNPQMSKEQFKSVVSKMAENIARKYEQKGNPLLATFLLDVAIFGSKVYDHYAKKEAKKEEEQTEEQKTEEQWDKEMEGHRWEKIAAASVYCCIHKQRNISLYEFFEENDICVFWQVNIRQGKIAIRDVVKECMPEWMHMEEREFSVGSKKGKKYQVIVSDVMHVMSPEMREEIREKEGQIEKITREEIPKLRALLKIKRKELNNLKNAWRRDRGKR